MLGPPSTLTSGFDSPCGRPTTVKAGASRSSHRTLLVEPSIRGLGPATRCVANKKATASPDILLAQGTGHGVPLVWLQPLCAHVGGSASVSTVPAQPPATGADDGSGWLRWVALTITIAAALALIGVLSLVALRRRPRSGSTRSNSASATTPRSIRSPVQATAAPSSPFRGAPYGDASKASRNSSSTAAATTFSSRG